MFIENTVSAKVEKFCVFKKMFYKAIRIVRNYRMILVQNREATTFILIIKENVITDNEIHTNSFESYARLQRDTYIKQPIKA